MVADPGIAEAAGIAAAFVALLGEQLHAARIARVAGLAFGPAGRPRPWVALAGPLRALAAGALAWSLVTLATLAPKVHRADGGEQQGPPRHLVVALDVSPSMRLVDGGVARDQSRRRRAKLLVEQLLSRISPERWRVSVVAFYTGAKQVVVDSRDPEVVRNILDDLPLHHAFDTGPTRLLDALVEAGKLGAPWAPGSAALLVVTDGDTVPATGWPRLPASYAQVVVAGVGDPRAGKFIDGRQSRQDASTLRQVATRLGGLYHDGNEKPLGTDAIASLVGSPARSALERLTRREVALALAGLSSAVLALLPLLLHAAGTGWAPGVQARSRLGELERVAG